MTNVVVPCVKRDNLVQCQRHSQHFLPLRLPEPLSRTQICYKVWNTHSDSRHRYSVQPVWFCILTYPRAVAVSLYLRWCWNGLLSNPPLPLCDECSQTCTVQAYSGTHVYYSISLPFLLRQHFIWGSLFYPQMKRSGFNNSFCFEITCGFNYWTKLFSNILELIFQRIV